MGKTWVRGGSTQTPSTRPEHPPKRKRNAHVWTRDSASNAQSSIAPTEKNLGRPASGSKTFQPSTNQRPGQGQAEPGPETAESDQAAKRRRLSAQGRYIPSTGSQHKQEQEPTGPKPDQNAQQKQREAELAETERKEKLQRETESLRRQIAEEEAKVLAAKAAASRREAERAAAERLKQREWEDRKRRLDAGFAEAFNLTRELNASGSAPKVSAASNAEVERVLAAKSDLDVMQVKAGASAAAIKKRYRTMTLALHPDKCKAEKATDAFQRMVHAYQSLLTGAR